MKKLFLLTVIIAMAGILALVGCAQPGPGSSPTTPAATASKPAAEPITLRAVMAWPESQQSNIKFLEWVTKANQAAKGAVVIKIVGGPEAVPFAEQVGALKRGMIDIVHTAGGYYTDVVPEINAILLSQITPSEERKNGYYDLMNKIHQEKGLFYLGRTNAGAPLGCIFINVLIKSPKDLAGLKIRSQPVYDPLLKEYKAVPVNMQTSEIYNAMQQHVVDGFINSPTAGIVSMGFPEVTKYILSSMFYTNPAVVIANLDTWNKIPENDRKVLTDSFIAMEQVATDYWANMFKTEMQKAVDAGMKIIDFAPEDSKSFTDTAYRLSWEVILTKSPQYGPKLKQLSSK